WDQQLYTGASFVQSVRVLHQLWLAWQAGESGREVSDICATLGLHQDEVDNVLHILKGLGYVADTEVEDTTVWVLTCDPARSELQPLIDTCLIDTAQPRLQAEPRLIDAIAQSLSGQPMPLNSLFKGASSTVRSPLEAQ